MNIEESTTAVLQFEKRGGLLPAIAQDAEDGSILMIGSINQEAWDKTLSIGYATFFSTSRNQLWTKGLTSGDKLKVVDIFVDCDQDAVIYKVIREGSGACHTKNQEGNFRKSCFYRKWDFENNCFIITEK